MNRAFPLFKRIATGHATDLAEHLFCLSANIMSPPMKITATQMKQSALSALDLAIDFATLGEYGLETTSTPRSECKVAACATGREDLARSLRGGHDRRAADRFCDSDWAYEGWTEPRRPAVAAAR